MAVQIVAGYWNLDLKSRELLLCPRSRQMFGMDGSSPKKLGKHDWVPRIHPDDIRVIDCELQAAGRLNEIYTARFRAIRPDGSLCHILGVGRTAARDRTRFVGLNFDLAATAATAILESRRPGGTMARFKKFLTDRPRPANENATQRRPERSFLRYKSPALGKRAREQTGRQMLLERALATIKMRQLRHKFLNPAMLGEPAFDMLLALYVTKATAAILPLHVLSPLVGVSEKSAARWLKFLVSEGLALGVGGYGKPGSIHAAITDKGSIILDEYFAGFDK